MTKKAPAKNVEGLIAEIRAKCVGGDFVFRGTTRVHSNVKDGVNSSLYRWAKGAINQYYKPSDIEKEIVGKARKHFPAQTSNIEILTVLRHYGGRVNLIDFSRNLYVALFFACNGEFGKDGEIILVDTIDTDKCKKLEEINYKKLAKNSGSNLGIIEPSQIQESRARAAVQSSVFLYSSDGYIKQKLFTHHTIPQDLKENVLNHIEEFNNITIDTIYNDIIGFISNEKNYETAAMCFYQGNKETSSGNHEKAIHYYNKAIEINPQDAEAFNNRGIAKAKLGNHKEAIQDYNKALEINPQSAEAFNNRGNAKAEIGNQKEAIQDFDQAIEVNPQSAEAFNNRGNAKTNLHQHEEAIQDYNKALEINPQSAEAFNNRGTVKAKLGNQKEAIQDFDQAIEINPQLAEAYFSRGLAKALLDNHTEAITDLDQAIAINPQDAEAYHARGFVKQNMGDEAGAEEDRAISAKLTKSQNGNNNPPSTTAE